ncbi:MAG: hypothetical protein M3Z02_03385 [Actinomycetota bacterium]|nr:hypothetical protein [Actinomycetota bacterium]
MSVRKILISVAAAGVLSTGFGGVALAASPAAPAPTAATPAADKHHGDRCKDVAARSEKLEHRRTAIEARLDKVRKAHEKAVARNADEAAKRLEARADKLHKADDRVVDRIAKLHDRCSKTK